MKLYIAVDADGDTAGSSPDSFAQTYRSGVPFPAGNGGRFSRASATVRG